MAKHSKEIWKTYGNVFDEFTKKNLFKFSSQGFFEELESSISLGKEANIFSALNKEGHRIIVKIYRLENCNFNKMYDYIRTDPRYGNLKQQRRKIIFGWVQREYRNLVLAREVIHAPTPIAFKNNIILMEFIGDNTPAIELKDIKFESITKAKLMLDLILDDVKRLKKINLVHADLSAFNILIDNDKPCFIDFSQATTLDSPRFNELLNRDLTNIFKFFRKHMDISEDEEEEIKKKILH